MEVANPIYDVVFKFLMEDERVARTILSALLKQEVLSVEMRPMNIATRIGSLSRCSASTLPPRYVRPTAHPS